MEGWRTKPLDINDSQKSTSLHLNGNSPSKWFKRMQIDIRALIPETTCNSMVLRVPKVYSSKLILIHLMGGEFIVLTIKKNLGRIEESAPFRSLSMR